MFSANPTAPSTPESPVGVVFMKNYSYTYAWFYLPLASPKLQ